MTNSGDQTAQRSRKTLPAISFAVTVVDGSRAGARLEVVSDRPSAALVGKSPVCELVLDDPLVSRRHASLEHDGYRLCVTDLDSRNGTSVNGLAVGVAYLGGGDLVRVGDTTLRVDVVQRSGTDAPARAAFGRMIGESAKMKLLFRLCEHLATSDVPLIVEGETGTGKGLAAECIHDASACAAGPFVEVDCLAIPRAALESTLFGEVAADGSIRSGLLETAHGGTLFFNEVAELDLESQGKILRVIERREVLPVGASAWRKVDARVIAASRRNLDKLVETGLFREDLFFRLAVARLELPPLRRRDGDMELLARHFFASHGKSERCGEFVERHRGYDWPGNVRELQNSVARVVVLGDMATTLPSRASRRGASADERPDREDALSEILASGATFSEARQRMLQTFERAFVEKVLAAHDGNVSRAAAASGLGRRYFQMLRARQR